MLNLKVSALGFEPVLDVALWISGEAEHEVPLDLQLVDGLNGLVYLERDGRHRAIRAEALLKKTVTLRVTAEDRGERRVTCL